MTTATPTRPRQPLQRWFGFPRLSPRMVGLLIEMRAHPSGHVYTENRDRRTLAALEGRHLVWSNDEGANYWLNTDGAKVADQLIAERAWKQFWAARTEGTLTREIVLSGPQYPPRFVETYPPGTPVTAVQPTGDASILFDLPNGSHVGTEYGAVRFAADGPEAALDALFEQGKPYGAPEDPEAPSPYLDDEGDLNAAGERYLANIAARQGSTEGPARTVRAWPRMRFVHARHLVEVRGEPARTWPHEVCVVTAVRNGTVYYKTADAPGGAAWYAGEDRFADEMLEILADYPDQTEPCTVGDLREGDVFSADAGTTWHTCAVVLFGTVSVYCDQRRDGDAPTRRIALERVEPVWRGVR